MKKIFNVTVDGVSHQVEVEEVGGSASSNANVLPVKNANTIPQMTNNSAPKVESNSGEKISAPLQGSILDIKVSAGQQVKSGDVLVVIEAMKMENEIVAPHDGTITSVAVSKGQKVSAGDTLIIM